MTTDRRWRPWCALVRPDVFRSVVLMSAPFDGPPALPFDTADAAARAAVAARSIHDALAALMPPRKHYQWYYSTPAANADMWHCPQGVHDFLRAYYHFKSGDWTGNEPFPLASWSAASWRSCRATTSWTWTATWRRPSRSSRRSLSKLLVIAGLTRNP